MREPRDKYDDRRAMPPDALGKIEAKRLGAEPLEDARLGGTRVEDERSEAEEPLRCVWSGFPRYDRSCRSRIPLSVVVKAWQRERQLKASEEGFFYFSWRSGVWLAYGLGDGGVRGVYCPTHCSERDSRELQEDDPSTDRPMGIALQ